MLNAKAVSHMTGFFLIHLGRGKKKAKVSLKTLLGFLLCKNLGVVKESNKRVEEAQIYSPPRTGEPETREEGYLNS